MSHLDEARYGRACLLLLNVCPFTLRKVIIDFYTSRSYPNLQNFLDDQTYKHDLFHLLSKSCCCGPWQNRVTPIYRSQWNLLYDKKIPPGHRGYSGDCPCKYNARPGITCDVMDITLCCLILTNICSGPPGINMTHIKTIREIRNKLIHASSASLDEITFKDYWMKIETAIYDLAKNVSPTVLTDTQIMVKELESRVMNYDELGELRKILLDQKKFAELEEKVLELDRDHGNTSRTVTQMEGNVNKMTERITQMEGGNKQMEGRVDQKVSQIQKRVKRKGSQMEGRMDKKTKHMERNIDGRMTQIEGNIDGRMTQIEGNIDGRMTQMEGNMEGRIIQMEENMDGRMTQMEGNMDGRMTQMEGNMDGRMTQMEISMDGRMTQMEGNNDGRMTQMEGNMDGRMTQMEGNIDGRMTQMEGNMDGRMTQMEGSMDGRMTQMEGNMDWRMTQMEGNNDGRMTQIEGQMNQKMTEMAGGVNQIEGKISNLEYVVDKHGQEIKQMKDRTDFPRGEVIDIDRLKSKLFDINDYKTKKIPISPLQKGGDKMPIELLYASVVIREDPKYATEGHESSQHTTTDPGGKSNKQQTREVTNPDDIFKKDGEVSRTIYMLGDAAHGKTTYCMWLLKKWCNAQQGGAMESKVLYKWEKALHEFDFVFLLQFRDINASRASVIDMICQDVFGMGTDYHSTIRHVLSSGKYRSLIIMDGLDEWNPNEETTKQLTYKGMPNIEGVASTVSCFISMRPWVFQTISKIVERSDRVIEIHGLSDTGMKKVIQNVLLNHYKLKDGSLKCTATYNKIVSHLENENFQSFMKIPLLAVVCVQIWYNGQEVGDSMTSFYAVMVDMLIERADQKHKLQIEHSKTEDCKLPQIFSEKENIANYFSVLLKIGKVAYDGLLSDETNLVFQKRKLHREIGERELQFALDVGLISHKESPGLTTNNVSVHFFHKSIQEFLAVIYIVTQKEVSDLFRKYLSDVYVIMELSNVIKFICGMCPSLASVISQHVASVTDSDKEICQYRESPDDNDTVKELYKLQVAWYRELQYGQTDRPVTDSPVTFHVSDVFLRYGSDTETVMEVRELLQDPHVDIRSLTLMHVPTDVERVINNTELCDFLSNTHRTRSMFWLYINGYDTPGRSVPPLCVPTLRCLHLYKVTINTELCGNVCPPLLTDTSKLRVIELRSVTLGEGGLGLSSDMVHIESIQLDDVNLGESGLGLSPNMVHLKRIKLYNVKLGEGGLGLSPKMVHIERIHLYNVNLGERGLGLSPNMVHLKRIKLKNVKLGERGLGLSPNMVHLERIKLENVKLGEGGLGLSPNMVHLERIELTNVNLGERGLGLSPNMVYIEGIVLCDVTLGERGLGLSPDMVHIKWITLVNVNLGERGLGLSPNMVDIEWITLVKVTLGERGLGISPNMDHINEVELRYVDMPSAGWRKLLLSHIQHRFSVKLFNTNIDDVSLTMIRSSPDFIVTEDGVDEFDDYVLKFT